MKKFMRVFLVVLIILSIAFLSFTYWGMYDEGVRAGNVLRISKKGIVFKTYEGQLSIQSFGALKNVNPLAETFDFSVEKDRDSIISALEEVALTGERVNLRYIKRYISYPWRGKTRYFIRGVERMPADIRQPVQENQYPR
jgi:hypothetical protein